MQLLPRGGAARCARADRHEVRAISASALLVLPAASFSTPWPREHSGLSKSCCIRESSVGEAGSCRKIRIPGRHRCAERGEGAAGPGEPSGGVPRHGGNALSDGPRRRMMAAVPKVPGMATGKDRGQRGEEERERRSSAGTAEAAPAWLLEALVRPWFAFGRKCGVEMPSTSATLLCFNHCRCCARRRECCSGRRLPSAGDKTYMTKKLLVCGFFCCWFGLFFGGGGVGFFCFGFAKSSNSGGKTSSCGIGKRGNLCADGIRPCLCKRTLGAYFPYVSEIRVVNYHVIFYRFFLSLSCFLQSSNSQRKLSVCCR